MAASHLVGANTAVLIHGCSFLLQYKRLMKVSFLGMPMVLKIRQSLGDPRDLVHGPGDSSYEKGLSRRLSISWKLRLGLKR